MIIREIELTALDYHENWTFDTIFFGGGTPSLMETFLVSDILEYIEFNTLGAYVGDQTPVYLQLKVDP